MKDKFNATSNKYNFRNFEKLVTEKNRKVKIGLETISYCAPELWSFSPEAIKLLTSLDVTNASGGSVKHTSIMLVL